MPYQLPTYQEILKKNKFLPDHLQQCSVVLEFQRNMPKHLTENFYRVQLTRNMYAAGEDDFWLPQVLQPGRSGKQKCLGCGRIAKRVGVLSTICNNNLCGMYGRPVINGPKRGVQDVRTDFEALHPRTKKATKVSFVVGREWYDARFDDWLAIGAGQLKKRGVDYDVPVEILQQRIRTVLNWPVEKMPVDIVKGCIAVLDRRYSEACLCAVWRTCGMLCDQMGWKLA